MRALNNIIILLFLVSPIFARPGVTSIQDSATTSNPTDEKSTQTPTVVSTNQRDEVTPRSAISSNFKDDTRYTFNKPQDLTNIEDLFRQNSVFDDMSDEYKLSSNYILNNFLKSSILDLKLDEMGYVNRSRYVEDEKTYIPIRLINENGEYQQEDSRLKLITKENWSRYSTTLKPKIHKIIAKWTDTPNGGFILNDLTATPSPVSLTFNSYPYETFYESDTSNQQQFQKHPPESNIYYIQNALKPDPPSSGSSSYDDPFPSYLQNDQVQVTTPANNIRDRPLSTPTSKPFQQIYSYTTQTIFVRPTHFSIPTRVTTAGPDPIASASDTKCSNLKVTLNNRHKFPKSGCDDMEITINNDQISSPSPIKKPDTVNDEYFMPEDEDELIDEPNFNNDDKLDPPLQESSPNAPSAKPGNAVNDAPADGAGSGGAGSGGAGSGDGKPPKHGQKPNKKPGNDDSGIGPGVMETFLKGMAYLAMFNPFNFGLWSIIFSPVMAFMVGGTAIAMYLFPWATPGVLFARKNKAPATIVIHKQVPIPWIPWNVRKPRKKPWKRRPTHWNRSMTLHNSSTKPSPVYYYTNDDSLYSSSDRTIENYRKKWTR